MIRVRGGSQVSMCEGSSTRSDRKLRDLVWIFSTQNCRFINGGGGIYIVIRSTLKQVRGNWAPGTGGTKEFQNKLGINDNKTTI